jgi:hypothetical protein
MTKQAIVSSQVIQKQHSQRNVLYFLIQPPEIPMVPEWVFPDGGDEAWSDGESSHTEEEEAEQQQNIFDYGHGENAWTANFEIPEDLVQEHLQQEELGPEEVDIPKQADAASAKFERENEGEESISASQTAPSTPDLALSSDEEQVFFSPISQTPPADSRQEDIPRGHPGYHAGRNLRQGEVSQMQAAFKALQDESIPQQQSVATPPKKKSSRLSRAANAVVSTVVKVHAAASASVATFNAKADSFAIDAFDPGRRLREETPPPASPPATPTSRRYPSRTRNEPDRFSPSQYQ